MQPRVVVLIVFAIITLLTALAVLAAAVGWLPKANQQLVTWGIPTVLGEIIATMVMFFRGQWGNQVIVNIAFGDRDPIDIDFDIPNCQYTIVDSTGKQLSSGNIAPTLGYGGWQINLPVNVNSDQSISLSLTTQTGERWQVRPFLPLVHTQAAVKLD